MDEITSAAPPDPQQPLTSPSLPFRRPADYYSSPVGEVRPLFPPWVLYGCGTASIIVLILGFALAYAASHGAMGAAMDWMLVSMEGEVDKMMAKDVKPADKTAFAAEMKTLRASVRENRVKIDQLQPFLRTLREVSLDEKVTPAETEQLTKELRGLNRLPRR